MNLKKGFQIHQIHQIQSELGIWAFEFDEFDEFDEFNEFDFKLFSRPVFSRWLFGLILIHTLKVSLGFHCWERITSLSRVIEVIGIFSF